MSNEEVSVNTIAPLTNVALCVGALDLAINRPPHLPGMVSFYGPSGYGKSSGAAYAANKFNAYYVECKSTWTKKSLLSNILKEMGMAAAKSISDMTDQISEQLALSGRPLIIDEFDHIVKKNAVEVVRDIYEGSGSSPILLIGEERLEDNLAHWERFHNRILKWVPAQPASMDDAQLLRQLYCQKADIADDILNKLMEVTKGCVRRICVNLYNAQEYALENGLGKITLSDWGTKEFYTGKAPKRRI